MYALFEITIMANLVVLFLHHIVFAIDMQTFPHYFTRILKLNNLAKDVIHRERAARGSCSCVKWTTNLITGDTILFAGFSSGNISAFLLRDKVLQAVSSLPLGSPVSLFIYRYTVFSCDFTCIRI